MSDDVKYYVAFSHATGIGPIRFQNLLKNFGDVKSAYTASEKNLIPILGSFFTKKFIEFRQLFKADSVIKELYKKSIHIIPFSSAKYPYLLSHISDPPICLYLKGDSNIFKNNQSNFFAVVGTRRVTSYGRQVAITITRDITNSGFVIVSGMAIGIDSIAQYTALDTGGTSVGVLGCGVDIIYPRENANLYSLLCKKGAVISEFPPGHMVAKGLFVARNRIISGLSKGLLVVEGARQSGTLITARYAAEQGRDVFAPPSPITSALSQAPNILIQNGAKLVTCADDILKEYNISSPKKNAFIDFSNLNKEEEKVTRLLLNESLTIDAICEKTRLSLESTLLTITNLEINKIVTKNDDATYSINR